MTPNIERMAVNAAIEKLIARADEDGGAARIVIKYGSKLKKSARIQAEFSFTKKSSDNEISGYVPGQGEVTIKDKEREEQKDWAFGINKDRIGHYRLWKEYDGLLKFHHFWKSGITTKNPDEDDPDEFHLGYDKVSLEPIYLGVRREYILFTLWFGLTFEIKRFYLERISGNVRMPTQGFGVELLS